MTSARSFASRPGLPGLLMGVSLLCFGVLLFKHVSHPLFWQDEAVTAVFGAHVLDYGYPKVHAERVAVYPTDLPLEAGRAPESDAYRAAPWGAYYLAAIPQLLFGGVEDPWVRTGLMRCFFAALGSGGPLLLLLAIWPVLGSPAERRLATAAYALLAASCISLVLHLREVGALAPTLLLLGGILYRVLGLQRARILGEALPGPVRHGLVMLPLLFALGATSTLAGASLILTLLVHALARGLRRAEGVLAYDLLPLLLAALALYPVMGLLGAEGLRWDLLGHAWQTRASYGAALGDTVLHLLRYEWLAPVLLARATVRVLARVRPLEGAVAAARAAACDLLCLLVIVHLLMLGALPVFVERHSVLLSPILCAILVLDASSLLAWLRAQTGGLRQAGIACASAVGLAVLVVGLLHGPEIAGRIHEITHPYQGPVDRIVRYVREHYERPETVAIATNGEGAALYYYLGSIVLIDTYPTRLSQDYLHHPRIIVPRAIGRAQRHLARLAVRSSYEQEDLPVENLRANNVPTLSPRDASGLVHRFETAELPAGRAGVPLLERAGELGPEAALPDSK